MRRLRTLIGTWTSGARPLRRQVHYCCFVRRCVGPPDMTRLKGHGQNCPLKLAVRDSDGGRQMREKMIELYTAAAPNGWKATIALEELGLDYELHPVDLAAGEQRQESFLRLNPNGRIPVIVDRDGPVRAPWSAGRSRGSWPPGRCRPVDGPTSGGPATHRIHWRILEANGTSPVPAGWPGSPSRIRRALRCRGLLVRKPGRGF